MSPVLAAVVLILAAHYLLRLIEDGLNLRHLQPELPAELADVFDAGRYRQSQSYLRDTTRWELVAETHALLLTAGFLVTGGFDAVDTLVRRLALGPVPSGLVYLGLIGLAAFLLQLPFAVIRTFVIEARYGFNRTTPRTFVLDTLKTLALALAIGGGLLAIVLGFFGWAGRAAWLYVWAAVTVVELALAFIAPALILPLFNKFTPLPDGELRQAIEGYARSRKFALAGIFTMDGSRRSAKSNAFFTGFGRFRRIVLFDTLIERHTVPELLAVLAHEMGHYKRRHVAQHVALSIAGSGLMFWLMSLVLASRTLSQACGMSHYSLYANLVFFLFLYTPLATLLGIGLHALSRRHEYEADAYAAADTGPAPMISALKKLSRDNLSNLTPHPLKVFLSYTHPPVLARIRALQRAGTQRG